MLYSNLEWGVIDALIGILVGLFAQEVIAYWRAHSGFLTGTWHQTIYDGRGNIDKMDRITIRHVGNVVKGCVNRLDPIDQNHKRWQFYGRIEGHMLFCIFWSTDLRKNPGSYGTIQLHMIHQSRFTGFYVRLKVASDLTGFSETMTSTKLEWKRVLSK